MHQVVFASLLTTSRQWPETIRYTILLVHHWAGWFFSSQLGSLMPLWSANCSERALLLGPASAFLSWGCGGN